jgi:hypothetical protein
MPGLPSTSTVRPSGDDSRCHRAQHALARRDRVGLAAQKAERVRRVGTRAEVSISLLSGTAPPPSPRSRTRRSASSWWTPRCRRRQRPNGASSQLARSRAAIRADARSASHATSIDARSRPHRTSNQSRHGHLEEIGSPSHSPVRIHAALRLDHQVHLRAVFARAGERIASRIFSNSEEPNASGTGAASRRRGSRGRCPSQGALAADRPQIGLRDQPARRFHSRQRSAIAPR